MSDPRSIFVCATIAGAIAPSDQKESYAKYLAQDSNGSIKSFLDDASINSLTASVSGLGSGQVQLQLSTYPDFPEGCEYQITLSKIRAGPISASDIPGNIQVSSVSLSPMSSFYHSIKSVYGPLLEAGDKSGKFSQKMDPKLMDLIQQLQAGLGAAIRRGSGQQIALLIQDPNMAPLQSILTPIDELDYWSDMCSVPGPIAKVAQQIYGSLEPLRSPFQCLLKGQNPFEGQMGFIEGGAEGVKELIDQVLIALREVWTVRLASGAWAFSQPRCDNFLKVVGVAMASYIQAQARTMNLWTSSFADVKSLLTGGSQAMSNWVAEAKSLTQDWSMGFENGGHEWDGSAFTDNFVFAFQERMEEVYRIRETHEELSRLMRPDEAQSLGIADVFQPFARVNALQVSDFTTASWKGAKDDYTKRMGPIQQSISQRLRTVFTSTIVPAMVAAVSPAASGGAVTQPLQIFQELKKYSGLMGMPIIASTLVAEKDALAKQVDKHLDKMQRDFETQQDAARSSEGGTVAHVMWAMQAQLKLGKAIEMLKMMIAGSNAGGDEGATLRSCLGVAQDLSSENDQFKQQLYDLWLEDTQQQLDNMSQWKNSRLLTFDSHNSHIKMHFNEQIVVLLREVRQLQSLGMSMPKEILQEVDTATKFYRYGMVLKQSASFYNNISTEMIPCQKPMMLKDAIEFEKVLMNPRDAQNKEITWRSAAALEGYVRRLSEVADRLAEKNRMLRKWHDTLRDKVVTLAGTDLVRYKDRWAQGVKEIRDIFGKLENEGYSRESQMTWRQFWDFQLYKALEYQYTQGLECINKTLPEVEIKMVFRQHKLQFDPPLEEVRIRHHKEFLNTFLGLPLRMKGASDLSERPGFFTPIVDGSTEGIAKVYAAAEALFAQLGDELKKYNDWVVMGGVDLEEFVSENLQEVEDWELNFKMLKAAARDAEKLPNEAKVDCYKISLLPVKAAVDEHMKKLQEALVTCLRRKTLAEKEQVEDFMKGGKELFTREAYSVEDIGKSGQEARNMVDELVQVGKVKRRIDDKNKLLRAMAVNGKEAQYAAVDMSEVNNAWESFTTQLQQFDAHLDEQKAQLSVLVAKQLDDFRGKVAGFASRWHELKPKAGPSGNPGIVLQRIEEYSLSINELQEESAKLKKDAEAFNLEVGSFDSLEDVAGDVAATKAQWDRYADFLKERNDMADKDWLSARDQVWKIEDFLTKWTKATEGKGADDPIVIILLKEIDQYKRMLPYLKSCMRGAGWEDSHWIQMFTLIGLKTNGPNAVSKETVTLTHFLNVADAVVANADAIRALDAQAQGESTMRKALAELKIWGLQREFELSSDANAAATGGKTRRTALIKEWRNVMSEVGDHQSMVASLKQSSYLHLFKDEVNNWEGKFGFLQEGLQLLNQIQRKWVYLEPIFARGALPAQQVRFRNVDEEFRRVMTSLEQMKKVVSFAEIPGIRDKLPQMAQQLDVCQRALSDFLEEKRGSFPRFYFLGDDDLLEILGQAKNPVVIQSHLKKLFVGIHKVKFSSDNSTIGGMQSMETEVVEFNPNPIGVTEAVEQWLTDLAAAMKKTLMIQHEAVRAGRLNDEFKAASSQILCLKEAVSFTASAEAAIKAGSAGLKKLSTEVTAQLQRMATSDFTGFNLLQLKKQALILDFIHYVDICSQLISNNVSQASEWTWRRQLRYYAHADATVNVAMAEAKFDYSWEYQGNAAKLVYTPLTDKCYLTLTQGMALGYGGNPYGPAGTGKTESVKALGQAFARQVLVFNCDEEFDFKSMGRIFVGLVKCGAWGCFDEFNRLDEEVLSAVSQQIQIIQGALRAQAKTMQFLEKTVEVDRNAGIFVTLNPAGKGYGGRSKLPDNLKQLFRSIAMTVPDNELIAEVLLLSEGFVTAKDLARKLIALFTLSRELLSRQQHYDWGLRALKTCLGIAGRELRETRKSGIELNDESEMSLMIRAVCAVKLPTLTFDDNRRFRDLLADLFPGIDITDSVDANLDKAIREVASSMKLDLTSAQMDKIWQLHLACEQRIGIIIVGPSGSGKSTLWEVLEKAYEKLGKKPITYKMNPKAMPRQQLLGSMNLDTREWSDGVLTAAARKVVKEPLEQRSWIICDGDVDPEWIESLNSVLDDNRLLTMPNGERIQFANNINFIFECHSLQFASPATVSRCGMIFLSDEAVDVERMLKRWLQGRPASDQAQMETWCRDYLHRALDWALKAPRAVETTKVGLLDSALSHLSQGVGTKRDFVVGLARGLGANMTSDVRADFVNDLGKMAGEGGLLEIGFAMDPLSILGDELRDTGLSGEIDSTLVQTDQVQKDLVLIAPWLKNREPIILVGPDGCGKATLIEHCLKKISGAQVAAVSCNAQTNAANVIQKLVQVCGKPVTTNTGKALRPPDNSRLILYLKDINLPRPDKYQTAQLVAFLQQLLTHEGYFDENLEFIKVERVQIIASISPPSTVGRHGLSTRFTARARVAYMSHPDKDAMQTIYSQMIDRNLGAASGSKNNLSISAPNLASCMIELYNQVKDTFSVNDQPHYQFNPRDVTAWVHGLKRYDLHSVTLPEAVAYEGSRVFKDRLVDTAGENFSRILTMTLGNMINFRGDLSTIVCSTLGASAEDRMSPDADRLKMVKWTMETFQELVAEKLKGFEREFKELNMMLFSEVLERIAQYDRVLSNRGGSLLLCGSSGVGRRSCMLLLAYMHLMEFYSPKMTKNYDMKAFRNDLKEVLKKAGVEGKPVMLFLEDYQMLDPAYLEYINSLLSGGEVPGLFTSEELAKELMPLEGVKNNDSSYTGPPTLYAYFTHRVQNNLHVVVSMDPSNELFRPRCESNPALITRASVQWLESWSNRGMKDIAVSKIKAIEAVQTLTPSAGGKAMGDGSEIATSMCQVHSGIGINVQPREYIAFVNLFSKIYSKKRKQVSDQKNFLQGGLSKLKEAEDTVDTLSRAADKQRAELVIKQKEAEEALVSIQQSMMTAADRSKEVAMLKKQQAIDEVEMKSRRGGVEAELAEVQPMIDAARKAVGQIKKDNIDEIRSLKMPPEAIRDVLEGVLTVLNQQDTSWNNMKKFLGHKSVRDDIIEYDARKITPEIRSKVDKLLAQKGNSFQEAVIYRVSVAAAPLAAWVKANMSYSKVLEKVAPLENELQGLKDRLDESGRLIVQYEKELKECDEAVATLKTDFSKKTSVAETLRAGLERAEGTVNAARNLLDKLVGEKSRWVTQVQTLEGDLQGLPLASLVTSAFVTYLPMLPEEQRASIQRDWSKMLGLQDYDLCRFMSTESEMLKWKMEGLPADGLSMQNAVVILNSARTPLIIDPSSQAGEWLKAHLSAKGGSFEATTLHDPRFGNTLELAVRFGKTLIIQEADKLEPVLYPLLRMDLDRQGPRFVVQIGDKAIDYNDTFRLYLVTRNPEPYLPPDARGLVSATNFTVTRSGLEGQLLGLTIQKEQPELEAQKSSLLKQEEELKVQLADLEKSLLETLANSTGNILENKVLLDSLTETKVKSTTIATSLTDSKQLQLSLDKQREGYRPIAARGSAMYFLIKDLATINHMYQFSLGAFLNLFRKALSQDSPPGNISSRIAVLNDSLLELTVGYVSRALFNSDRLVFGMHMACNMASSSGSLTVKPEEWQFFLGKVSTDASAAKGSTPSWVREDNVQSYALLAANFPALVQSCELHDAGMWAPWVTGSAKAAADGSVALPSKIAGKVSPFQSLLIVKAFQPEKLQSAMNAFVCSTLNIKSVAPSSAGIKQVMEQEGSCEQPVLFITTPGADPSADIIEYAHATVGADRFHEVAMGQGQAEVAVNLLRNCARSGDWLCLKNVHLAVSWLPSLEKEMYTLNKHEGFRLLLTSESHSKFPKTLLEGSLKITFEAPPGMKKNMMRTYEGWSQEFIAQGGPARAQLLFVLSWFHAVVQERRNYIPQGWSKFYEFSGADLRSGSDIIELATKGGSGTQWQLLHGLLENAIYGGRIDNKFDGKVLKTYLQQYFNPENLGQGKGSFKTLPGSKVAVPTSAHRNDYTAIIASLADVDVPALFSLPLNIDRSVQRINSEKVVTSLKQMSISRDAIAGFNRAQWQQQLGPLLRLWDQLMSGASSVKTAIKEVAQAAKNRQASTAGIDKKLGPVDDFASMERGHGTRLVTMIDSGLVALGRVLKGQEALSSSVQKLGTALLSDQVPGAWDSAWEGPENPTDYCRAVVARAVAVETWHSNSQRGNLLSSGALDLSNLFHPGTFLNALRQHTARQRQIPLDMLKLASCWDQGRIKAASSGSEVVQIGGLQMQGAMFDGQRFTDLTQEAPTSRTITPMSIAWVPKEAELPYGNAYMSVPLYYTQGREKVLTEVQLPVNSDEEVQQWTLAGLALFLSA